jgi:alpha-D-ribose 1-methylphosphonate 5-triphosphate diphosphatase PhnM
MWLSDLRVVLPDRVLEQASIRLERGRIRDVHESGTECAREIVEGVHALCDTLLTDIRVHAHFEITKPRVTPVLKDLLEQGMVDLVSLNDRTPGQGQYRDLERFVQYLNAWQGKPCTHVEAGVREHMKHNQDTHRPGR